MGKYTMLGRNAMLGGLGVDRVGAFTAGTAITGVTGTASTDILTKTSHGLTNGDLVVLTAITGGTGLAGFCGNAGNADENAWPLYIVGVSGNNFQVSHTSGGSAIDFTTDITALTVTKLTELSGGSPAYARKTIAYNAASGGNIDDSTNGAVIDVPASTTVDYLGYWNNGTSELRSVDKLSSPEVFGSQGTLTVTDSDHDLLAA